MIARESTLCEVWRRNATKQQAAWGNADTSGEAPYGLTILIGYKKSHDIWGTIGGRNLSTTMSSMPTYAPHTEAGQSLYCSVYDDIRAGDAVVYDHPTGRKTVMFVQGEAIADYVSPFSGVEGGKEVYLVRQAKAVY